MAENNYSRFKSLLEYFVAHLEYCQNEDETGRGYEKYIKGKDVSKSGQGYKDQAIQNQIAKWATYGCFTICISVSSRNGYATQGSYLHWRGTDLNIEARWDVEKKKIEKIGITKKSKQKELDNADTTIDLGLFDGKNENAKVKKLFDVYYALIENSSYGKVVNLLKQNHNIILHGAPGTGKTYLARVVASVMGATKENGQFEMVQFHPSYDYTDFVEGLRPTDKNEDGEVVKDIHFVRTDGIFKAFCKSAKEGAFIKLMHTAWENLWSKIKEKERFVLKNQDKTDSVPLTVKDGIEDRIFFNKKDGAEGVHSINWDYIKDVYIEFGHPDSTTGRKIGKRVGRRQDSTVWAVYNEVYNQAEELKKEQGNNSSKEVLSGEKQPNFIFLIDEINRGDLSKIFGELFFSIDPGYRVKFGKEKKAIKVPTQYQNLVKDDDIFKKGFYIPDNVYIIGTMNDIDRSVESMDFAMRRRFHFIEVKPEDRVDEMFKDATDNNKKELANEKMKAINDTLKKLGFEESYYIGPSYFIKLAKGEESAEQLWGYRLKGLLREYLRGMDGIEDKLTKLEEAFKNADVKAPAEPTSEVN